MTATTLLIPVSVVVVAAPGWLLARSRRRSASDIDWDVHCESMLRMVGARGVQR